MNLELVDMSKYVLIGIGVLLIIALSIATIKGKK